MYVLACSLVSKATATYNLLNPNRYCLGPLDELRQKKISKLCIPLLSIKHHFLCLKVQKTKKPAKWGVPGTGPLWSHQYLMRTLLDPFLLGTGGPKRAHVPPMACS